MNKITGYEPAMPVHGGYANDDPRNHTLGGGLTIRQQFAMAAMQGLLCAGSTGMPNCEDAAKYAVEYADALIEALNKKEDGI